MSQLAWAAAVVFVVGWVFWLWERMPGPIRDKDRRTIAITLWLVGIGLYVWDAAAN
jgi:hypothetical protein